MPHIDGYNFEMNTNTKKLSLCMCIVLSLGVTACGSTPKGSDARAYARVKDWRCVLDLRSLERQYDLPKGLLSAVMHQESGGKANARSHVGAGGLFQIMPATARSLNLDSAYHPEPAAKAAAMYLSQLYNHYHSDLKLTLAAYNWGIGNVDRYLASGASGFDDMPEETKIYISRVTKLRRFYD